MSIPSVSTLWMAPNVNLSDGNERLKIRIVYFHQKVVNRRSYLKYITIKLNRKNSSHGTTFCRPGIPSTLPPCGASLNSMNMYYRPPHFPCGHKLDRTSVENAVHCRNSSNTIYYTAHHVYKILVQPCVSLELPKYLV